MSYASLTVTVVQSARMVWRGIQRIPKILLITLLFPLKITVKFLRGVVSVIKYNILSCLIIFTGIFLRSLGAPYEVRSAFYRFVKITNNLQLSWYRNPEHLIDDKGRV